MADRYWVGGTASWDGTAGTKWATTSGGAGGASVPTSADDVFFTNLSTGTVTISNANAKSINCTGFAGTIAGAGQMTVAGSITLSAGMTNTHTGAVIISATATLITSGKPFGSLNINAPGGTVTLGDALNLETRTFTLTSGTFDTAGYNLTCDRISSTTTNTRSLLWRSGTITLSGSSTVISITSLTGLTFDAGTSTFVLTGAGATLASGPPAGLVFYDVSFTSTVASNPGLGSATFRNLTIAAPSSDVKLMILSGDNTMTGALSITGSAFDKRVYFRGTNTSGSNYTLTAASLSADHCDFEDVILAGAASPASPTGAGDCGGNTGITFPAPKTVYRVGTDTTWAGVSSWATSSGGTGSNANFPLPQDTAIVDNATTGTSLTFSNYNRGALNMSSRTDAITLNAAFSATFYGSFILGSGVTVSGTALQTYRGRSTSTLTTAGKTLTFSITVVSSVGGLQLGDALSSSLSLGLSRGTFDAVTYPVTVTTFSSTTSLVRTLNMGSGLWTLAGTGTVWNTGTITNLTFNKGTADILLSSGSATARSFSGGGLSFNKLTIGGATGSGTTNLSTFTVTELASTKPVAHTITITSPTALTIGTWSVKGTAGNVVTLNSSAVGTRRTFNLTNVTASDIDYLAVQDIECLQADRFYVGANSTNNGNNVNVIFTASPVTPVVPSEGNVFRAILRSVFKPILSQGA